MPTRESRKSCIATKFSQQDILSSGPWEVSIVTSRLGASDARQAGASSITRRRNLAATLRPFWHGDTVTVNELIEVTGLTRATIHSVCNELMERGWVQELPSNVRAARGIGRPARVFRLHREAGYVLGLDVSVVHLGAMVTDLTGASLVREEYALADENDRSRRRRQLRVSVKDTLRRAGIERDQLLVVAVGVAAPVSRDGAVLGMGESLSTTTVLWHEIRRDVELLQSMFDDVVFLCGNDANLVLLAERWQGAAQGVDDLAVLLGNEENVGAAVMESGRLLYGRRGGFGEMYWLNGPEGPEEGTASVARLARNAARDAGLIKPRRRGSRSSAAASREDAELAGVLQAARRGDPTASVVLSRVVASVLATTRVLAILLNPEKIVLSGAAADWRDAVAAEVAAALAAEVHDPPRVASSTLAGSAVTIGAVWLGLEYIRAEALDIRPPNALRTR